MENVIRVCGNDRVLINFSQGMVRQRFAMDIFRVLCRIHFNPILSLLAITRLADVDWKATGVEWFSFEYERPKFISIPPTPWVTCKSADGREVTEVGHHEIHPTY